MGFSARIPEDMSSNPLMETLQGLPPGDVIDLTVSNPTHCGFEYPSLLESLGGPEGLRYDPEPLGHLKAREALAEHLQRMGRNVAPSQIVLTSSTSEAYSYLFKLLANPGENFLIPTPGYPLLEHLLRLESLEPLPYSLLQQPGWPLDLKEVANRITPKTRGLVVISPHNPTGSVLKPSEEETLLGICKQNRCALILDEVFSDYVHGPSSKQDRGPSGQVLTFRLGGLSKSLGLPQLKLSWILLNGPKEILQECREKLEFIADAYLSVNTPVQLGLKKLLETAPFFQNQVMERVTENRSVLGRELEDLKNKARLWPSEGGWYALVEILGTQQTDTQIALELLQKKRVFVHPGEFYDLSKGTFMVLSLLPPKKVFEEGVQGICRYLKEIV